MTPAGQHTKSQSKFIYKRSTLQTEGNLKKKGAHAKLSSIASEIKEISSMSNTTNLEMTHTSNPDYMKNQENNGLLDVDQKEYSELFMTKKSHPKTKSKLSMIKSHKITSMEYLFLFQL